jgi:hypothetical protein
LRKLTEDQRKEINKHYIDAVSDAAYTDAKEQGKSEKAARQEAAEGEAALMPILSRSVTP